jgi:rhodanese-related sulfurtransferase
MDFVQNNIFLIAIALISGGMLIFPMLRRSAGGPSVSAVEATNLINREDAVVIDVREADEFAKGHIIGARNFPLAQFESRLKDLDKLKSKPVILLCETGTRAGTALSQLRGRGFERAVTLSGGIGAWLQAGLPTGKMQAEPTSGK